MPPEVLALLIPIFAISFSFIFAMIVASNRYKLKMRELELKSGGNGENLDHLKAEVDQLSIENTIMKQELAQLKRSLAAQEARIELTPHEREQLKIDQNDKFTF